MLADGLWLAIHAGRKWDDEGAAFVERLWPGINATPVAEEGIVGLARVVEIADVDKIHAIGTPEYVAARPWASGPECWVLADVRALAEPIPCRGAQGLWRVPPAVETYLRNLAP